MHALFHLRFEFNGDGNLAHPALADASTKNTNRSVTLSLSLLTKLAPRLIAPHHSAQQGTGQDGGQIRDLLNELLPQGNQFLSYIFRIYTVKDNPFSFVLQVKKTKY